MAEEKKRGRKFDSSLLHIIQDIQGKIYLAEKAPYGWLTVEEIPLPNYGITDLGNVEMIMKKLALYRHASRVLFTTLSNNFQNYLNLVREIDND